MNWGGLLDGLTATVRDTFGEPVLYQRANDGPAYEITAIFDPDFEALAANGSQEVVGRIPVLDVRLADIGGGEVKQEDRVTFLAPGTPRTGKTYKVLQALPSSSGMMKAHLRKV